MSIILLKRLKVAGDITDFSTLKSIAKNVTYFFIKTYAKLNKYFG